DGSLSDLQVPKTLLQKASTYCWDLDLATGSSQASKTFTSSYGKLRYEGEGLSKAGPLLLSPAEGHGGDPWSAAEEDRGRFAQVEPKDWHRMRYFAPAEVSALMGYPSGWSLPEGLDVRSQWRLIGNSVNVQVVRSVLKRLFSKLGAEDCR
ncbi:unnamed protein product, partial [Polarella glacialis]